MRYLNLLGLLAIPAAFAIHLWLGKGQSWEPIATFFLACVGVIPLAALMGEATEHLSERTGPTWGGLINATFGNAAELILGLVALTRGLNDIVKASLTGSILGNILLVAGGAMVFGGLKHPRQTFNKSSAETNSGLLALAVAAMLIPAIFHFSAVELHDQDISSHQHALSIGACVILLVIYVLGLLFTLKTHAHIFCPDRTANAGAEGNGHHSWSVSRSIGMLLIASAGIAVIAELLVGSAEQMAHRLGWNNIFVGVIVIAIVGNAAEHSTALLLARRNDMDTAMTITYQSSLQIALFATPVLVFASALFVALGWQHGPALDLIFSPMEVVAVFMAVGVVIVLGRDGETNWFEGAVLLGLYAILAIAFFYIPTPAPHR